MIKATSKIVVVALAPLLVTGASIAQETVLDDKRVQINRISSAPDIDGRIEEGEWAGAARISDLHEVEPVEFTTPSERTLWYIAYDDKNLYVAAHAFEANPEEITAQVLRQGGSLFSRRSHEHHHRCVQ